MTDQPTTQERGARCKTCGAYHKHLVPPLNVEDVEGVRAASAGGRDAGPHPEKEPVAPSTTQEAEKAVEALEGLVELIERRIGAQDVAALSPELADMRAALRSLGTQHTEMQTEIAELHGERDALKDAWDRMHDLYTKDREEIERLKAALTESNKWHWMQHGVSDHRFERITVRYEARIADLERVLASLGQLTAGGSGDAAGSEVE